MRYRIANIGFDHSEILLREDAGEVPTTEKYCQRFPNYAAELEHLFEVHRAIAEATDQVASRVGRMISHYRIEHHLGSDGMGEIYLANDIALDRQARRIECGPGKIAQP